MPSLDGNHDELEAKVCKYITDQKGLIFEKTYHDGHLSKDKLENERLKTRISFLFTPTSLFQRAHADRWALMPNDFMFYFECKTTRGNRPDLKIEAMPLADHMRHAERGVMCLYACVLSNKKEIGFWCDDVPPISQLWIPPQKTKHLLDWYCHHLPKYFPMIAPNEVHVLPWGTLGSNDPFIVINLDEAIKRPSWQVLIKTNTAQFSENTCFGKIPTIKSDDDDLWEDA